VPATVPADGARPAAGNAAGAGSRARPSEVVELAPLAAPGAEQMARDERLLDGDGEPAGGGAPHVVWARRFVWSPPAASLGKFQCLADEARRELAAAGIDVVRRPSGGRLVLHGRGFEWSFAVVFPAGILPYGTHAAYRLVSRALARALADSGIVLDQTREEPYMRSALCFASALRHDLLVDGGKAVAVAQARRGDRTLVHGSVLERRPPAGLVAAVEAATGEPWRGDGLATCAPEVDGDALWRGFLARLRASLAASAAPVGAPGASGALRTVLSLKEAAT
jgi:lipoate-protein ligase A